MRALPLALLALAGCAACRPTPPNGDDVRVYSALVEAGCLEPSDGGVVAVAAEHAERDRPGWLACLYDGGDVAGCGVPCK